MTSIMAAATPPLPPDHATTLQHRRQSACKDADVILRGHSTAETVNKVHNLFPWFSQEMSIAMVHAPGLLHIGGAAYFVWAYPPNFGEYRENNHFSRAPRASISSHLARVPTGHATQPPPHARAGGSGGRLAGLPPGAPRPTPAASSGPPQRRLVHTAGSGCHGAGMR